MGDDGDVNDSGDDDDDYSVGEDDDDGDDSISKRCTH